MPLFSLHIVQHEYEWIQQLLFLSFTEKIYIYIYIYSHININNFFSLKNIKQIKTHKNNLIFNIKNIIKLIWNLKLRNNTNHKLRNKSRKRTKEHIWLFSLWIWDVEREQWKCKNVIETCW